MGRTLFDIGIDLAALDTLCNEAEDNLERGPELDATLATWFDQLKADESVKLENYVHYIRQLEMEASAAKAEAEQFQKKAQTRENRVKWLKERMKGYLEFTKREKVFTSTNRVIAIQKNGGVVPMDMNADLEPTQIDPRFTQQVVNTKAIRAALEGGETLPFARLGERGTHLRIK